jgi:hypothetical protein
MKQIFLLSASILLGLMAKSQTLTIDPALSAATAVQQVTENSNMNTMQNKQNVIEVAQATTAQAVNFINTWQQKIVKGLTEVSGSVSNAWGIINAGDHVVDIVNNYNQMIQLAQGEPLLLAFTVRMQSNIVNRATLAYTKIQTLVLESNERLLLTAGERMRILNQVNTELSILEAMTACCIARMKEVKRIGYLNAINPFYYAMQNDATIVNSILQRMPRF